MTLKKRPVGEHTMIKFKLNFEREYQALKRVRGITMRSTKVHPQANAMTTMLSNMKQEGLQILMEVKNTEEKYYGRCHSPEKRLAKKEMIIKVQHRLVKISHMKNKAQIIQQVILCNYKY